MSRLRTEYLSALLALCVLFFALWYVFMSPAPQFPAGHVITIKEGATLSTVATQLEEAHVIRSPLIFEIIGRLRGGTAKAGKYVFAEPIGVLRVEDRIQDGVFGISATRLTFAEGATAREMARTLKEAFPDFDDETFLKDALMLEGYLYPDTYFFYPDVTPEDVLERMYENFASHEREIKKEIIAFDRPLRDALIMASILEKEGRSVDEKRMIAGILWNRIERGMPLQVDAVFGYINDRPTYSPAFSELKIDSPYNTYTNKGLPPGPIGNPSVYSLLAAVTPLKTDSLYYLTGRDGLMRYAKTFEGHKLNRARYLD